MSVNREPHFILVTKKIEKNGDREIFNKFFPDRPSLSQYLKSIYDIEDELSLNKEYKVVKNQVRYFLTVTFE